MVLFAGSKVCLSQMVRELIGLHLGFGMDEIEDYKVRHLEITRECCPLLSDWIWQENTTFATLLAEISSGSRQPRQHNCVQLKSTQVDCTSK